MTINLIPGDAAQFVRCRSWQGHDWDDAPTDPRAYDVPRGWVTLSFRCARCGMRKTYVVNPRDGEQSRPYYHDRPKHYRAPGTTRADWRALFVRQMNGSKR
jgi:hypothetical protein